MTLSRPLKRFFPLGAAFVTAATAIPAASADTIKARPALIRIDQCGEVRTRLIDWAARQAVDARYGLGGYWDARGVDGRALEAAPSGGAATKATAGPSTYTGTNNQERGVDEADLVKTDGKYIFTVNGNDLVVIQSWPASDLHIVGRVALGENVSPSQLLLDGDRVVVFASVYQQLSSPEEVDKRAMNPYYGWGYDNDWFAGTRIAVYDVSRKAKPRLVHQTDLEGWMAEARLIGDDLYMISNAGLRMPKVLVETAFKLSERLPQVPDASGSVDWQKARDEAFAILRRHLRARLGSRLDLADAMPRTRSSRRGGAMGELGPMYSCRDLHVPSSATELGVLSLTHIDLEAPQDVDNVGVFASGWQIYASEGAVYVAMPVWNSDHFWGLRRIAYRPINRTQIHKFSLDRGGKPFYAASGQVRGHLLNQFSMSEHESSLRVATTDETWWNGIGEQPIGGNNLYVLQQRGRRLSVVGEIEGLAKGERIYSARMSGDVGYVVTFRQTDPLFTLDLRDPRAPKVAGELKINGFSSYIHPIAGDRLLTIGQDADDQGRALGAHLQIFDVSNPAAPSRLHHIRLGGEGGQAWSNAQYDHHAFTYDAVSRTLAIPVQTWTADWRSSFSGLMMFEIDDREGFIELGAVSHADQAQIQRSIIMDDYVYTLSPFGLQVNDRDEPSDVVAAVTLAPAAR